MILPEPRRSSSSFSATTSAANDLESAAPEFFQMLRQTRLIRSLLTSPVLLWMPYEVRVR